MFSGGVPLTSSQQSALPAADVVIAADSGIDRATEVGRRVDLAVGDFDSVSTEGLALAERGGATIRRHAAVKNETDLELALIEAIATRPDRIMVVALDGGRSDHYLAGIALLADRRFASTRMQAQIGQSLVHVVHTEATLEGAEGDLVSLLPVGGDAEGVTTSGLKYPLSGETLWSSSPRGMSNLLVSSTANVSITGGVLFAFQPGALG